MTSIKYRASDFRLKDGSNFDPFFTDYSEEQFLLVQMQIDANAKERERREKKADRDFKLAMIFMGGFSIMTLSLFVAVLTSSYLAVSQLQNQSESNQVIYQP